MILQGDDNASTNTTEFYGERDDRCFIFMLNLVPKKNYEIVCHVIKTRMHITGIIKIFQLKSVRTKMCVRENVFIVCYSRRSRIPSKKKQPPISLSREIVSYYINTTTVSRHMRNLCKITTPVEKPRKLSKVLITMV